MVFFRGVTTFLLSILFLITLLLSKGASELTNDVPKGLKSNKFKAIFNFGDSYSDTGSFSATFGRVPYPCGMTFFGQPSGRLCDGRLIIDFIAEMLGLPYLSGYLDVMGEGFKHGANFGVSGTTLKPVDVFLYAKAIAPISLNLQLLQFQQFKNRVDELHKYDETSMLKNHFPKPKVFSNALYTIDMGSNDIVQLNENSRDQANNSLPELVNYLSQAIEELHQLGARNFLIHNIGPLGCLPNTIDSYNNSDPEKLDEIGCVKFYNDLARGFNHLLEENLSKLRTKFRDSSIFYFDMYSAKYSLIRDAKQHVFYPCVDCFTVPGFTDPLGYCCEDCRKYLIPLWMRHVSNQTVVYKACDNPSKYISWDGSHYTEAANNLIANRIFDKFDPSNII